METRARLAVRPVAAAHMRPGSETAHPARPDAVTTHAARPSCEAAHYARLERPRPAGVELKALAIAVIGGAVLEAGAGEMHHAIAVHEAFAFRSVADAAGPAGAIHLPVREE